MGGMHCMDTDGKQWLPVLRRYGDIYQYGWFDTETKRTRVDFLGWVEDGELTPGFYDGTRPEPIEPDATPIVPVTWTVAHPGVAEHKVFIGIKAHKEVLKKAHEANTENQLYRR